MNGNKENIEKQTSRIEKLKTHIAENQHDFKARQFFERLINKRAKYLREQKGVSNENR